MFDVGDLVVCVDDTPNPHGAGPSPLRKGKHYRISYVSPDGVGVMLADLRPSYGFLGFLASRFRKIDAPDTEVSRLIRACKPVREGQRA